MSLSGPKPQKQAWLDYLIDTISKEDDPVVKESAAAFRTIADEVKAKTITRGTALDKLNAIETEVIPKAIHKYRTQQLFEGTIIFIFKEFKES